MHDVMAENRRLKGYVFFNKVEGGVYFQGQSGGFILKGEGIYPLVARLISFIDAGFRFSDIKQKLPEKLQAFFQHLVTQLAEHDMLAPRFTDPVFADLLPASWLAFQPLYDFVQWMQETSDDFLNKLTAWQQQRLVLVGNGYGLKSAIDGLACTGIRELSVLFIDDEHQQVSVAEVSERLNFYEAQLPGFSSSVASYPTVSVADVQAFDGLLWIHTDFSTESAEFDGMAVNAGMLAGQLLVSPVTSVSDASARDVTEQLNRVNEGTDLSWPLAAYSLSGSVAALNLLKAFFAIDQDTIANYVYRVSPFLEVVRHPVIPLPQSMGYSLTEALELPDFQAEFEMPEDRELAQYERVKLALTPWLDPLTGWLDESVAADIKQVPLFHGAFEVRFPQSSYLDKRLVLTVGLDAPSAGLRAISAAMCQRMAGLCGVPESSVVVAFDEDNFVRQSVASGLISSAEIVADMTGFAVNLNTIDDEESQLLSRFLYSAGVSATDLTLYWHPQQAVYLAQLNDVQAFAGTALQAIRACLADAYLNVQFPTRNRVSHESQLVIHSVEQPVDHSGQLLAQCMQRDQHTARLHPSVRIEPIASSLKEHEIYVGYVTLVETTHSTTDVVVEDSL